MEQWDDLLAAHAMHVLSPHLKKNQRDYKKFRFYEREEKDGPTGVKDPEYASAWLEKLKARQRSS